MVVVQVGAVKIYAAIVRRSGKRKEGMKLSLPPNLVEKTSLGRQIFRFVKFHFELSFRCPILCRNWPFSPPNRLTLPITLMKNHLFAPFVTLI
jgi:hypothetical protein